MLTRAESERARWFVVADSGLFAGRCGSLKNLIELSDEAMNILNSDSVEAAHE